MQTERREMKKILLQESIAEKMRTLLTEKQRACEKAKQFLAEEDEFALRVQQSRNSSYVPGNRHQFVLMKVTTADNL